MKAASGELNLTVITLIAIAAVLGFFWAMWPSIRNSIGDQWSNNIVGANENQTNGQKFS